MAVTLTGTNFVVGATTVNVAGGGVTVTNVVVGSSDVADRQLRARSGRRCWSSHGDGHDRRRDKRTASLHDQSPPPPTLTSVSPNQGIRGTTVAVTLTGTNFVVGATTVAVGGGGVTVTNVVVGSTTSLTASFVLDLAAAAGPRTVTVTTAGGTSGGANLHDQSAAARFHDVQLYGQSADLYGARRRRQRHDSGHRRAGSPGLASCRRHGWPGRSDDGDRVRHAGRVAHRACRGPGRSRFSRSAASTEAAEAPETVAAAAALRACVMAPPRS